MSVLLRCKRREEPRSGLHAGEEGSVLRMIGRLCIVTVLCLLVPDSAWAQRKPGEPAAAPAPGAPVPATTASEIRLDETTSLKAAALEARISAFLANFALLQRQAQDIQQEMTKLLEDRKALIEGAARKANVEVKNPIEWAFDNKGQRYVHVQQAR